MTNRASRQTEKTLHNHLEAAEQGDVEAIMADYAEDAVFFTPKFFTPNTVLVARTRSVRSSRSCCPRFRPLRPSR